MLVDVLVPAGGIRDPQITLSSVILSFECNLF